MKMAKSWLSVLVAVALAGLGWQHTVCAFGLGKVSFFWNLRIDDDKRLYLRECFPWFVSRR
jgi:hypothetical protein